MLGLPKIRDCTRTLAIRWGMVVFGISAAIVVILCIRSYNIPLASGVPRLIDPFAAFIPAALLAWLLFDAELFAKWWAAKEDTYSTIYAETGIGWGMVLGACTALFVAPFGGLLGVVVMTLVFTVVVPIWCTIDIIPVVRSIPVMVVGALTIWLVDTLVIGAISGLLYGISALAVSGLIYGSIWASIVLAKGVSPAAKSIGRWLTTCTVQDRQSS